MTPPRVLFDTVCLIKADAIFARFQTHFERRLSGPIGPRLKPVAGAGPKRCPALAGQPKTRGCPQHLITPACSLRRSNLHLPSSRITSTLVTMLQPDEVAKHSSAESLWVIVEGQAYDLTEFAPEHPGG